MEFGIGFDEYIVENDGYASEELDTGAWIADLIDAEHATTSIARFLAMLEPDYVFSSVADPVRIAIRADFDRDASMAEYLRTRATWFRSAELRTTVRLQTLPRSYDAVLEGDSLQKWSYARVLRGEDVRVLGAYFHGAPLTRHDRALDADAQADFVRALQPGDRCVAVFNDPRAELIHGAAMRPARVSNVDADRVTVSFGTGSATVDKQRPLEGVWLFGKDAVSLSEVLTSPVLVTTRRMDLKDLVLSVLAKASPAGRRHDVATRRAPPARRIRAKHGTGGTIDPHAIRRHPRAVDLWMPPPEHMELEMRHDVEVRDGAGHRVFLASDDGAHLDVSWQHGMRVSLSATHVTFAAFDEYAYSEWMRGARVSAFPPQRVAWSHQAYDVLPSVKQIDFVDLYSGLDGNYDVFFRTLLAPEPVEASGPPEAEDPPQYLPHVDAEREFAGLTSSQMRSVRDAAGVALGQVASVIARVRDALRRAGVHGGEKGFLDEAFVVKSLWRYVKPLVARRAEALAALRSAKAGGDSPELALMHDELVKVGCILVAALAALVLRCADGEPADVPPAADEDDEASAGAALVKQVLGDQHPAARVTSKFVQQTRAFLRKLREDKGTTLRRFSAHVTRLPPERYDAADASYAYAAIQLRVPHVRPSPAAAPARRRACGSSYAHHGVERARIRVAVRETRSAESTTESPPPPKAPYTKVTEAVVSAASRALGDLVAALVAQGAVPAKVRSIFDRLPVLEPQRVERVLYDIVAGRIPSACMRTVPRAVPRARDVAVAALRAKHDSDDIPDVRRRGARLLLGLLECLRECSDTTDLRNSRVAGFREFAASTLGGLLALDATRSQLARKADAPAELADAPQNTMADMFSSHELLGSVLGM